LLTNKRKREKLEQEERKDRENDIFDDRNGPPEMAGGK
jgi:hypothetical protein